MEKAKGWSLGGGVPYIYIYMCVYTWPLHGIRFSRATEGLSSCITKTRRLYQVSRGFTFLLGSVTINPKPSNL